MREIIDMIVNFENLCVICDKPTTTGRITCSSHCHEKFVQFCEAQYGISKKVIDQTTGIEYKVPTRDLIEKGLRWDDLYTYPLWSENDAKNYDKETIDRLIENINLRLAEYIDSQFYLPLKEELKGTTHSLGFKKESLKENIASELEGLKKELKEIRPKSFI